MENNEKQISNNEKLNDIHMNENMDDNLMKKVRLQNLILIFENFYKNSIFFINFPVNVMLI